MMELFEKAKVSVFGRVKHFLCGKVLRNAEWIVIIIELRSKRCGRTITERVVTGRDVALGHSTITFGGFGITDYETGLRARVEYVLIWAFRVQYEEIVSTDVHYEVQVFLCSVYAEEAFGRTRYGTVR